MKPTRRIRRSAKRLLRLCTLADGLLDEDRARRVARRVAATPSRTRLPLLAYFRRLVMLDRARHAARVETATPLPPELDADVRRRLDRAYGPGLTTSFAPDPALIAGMRIKVGSDVYDGSLRGRLAALEGRF
jgi:F-type H+-transporting ATPase subunit delta